VSQVAIAVLSNFGAIEDEALDAQATEFIVNEGGIDAIMDALIRHKTNTGV
jgi:hypothetical protein